MVNIVASLPNSIFGHEYRLQICVDNEEWADVIGVGPIIGDGGQIVINTNILDTILQLAKFRFIEFSDSGSFPSSVDLDIDYIVTGIVSEGLEDMDGGIVAIKNDDQTPLTRLLLRQVLPSSLGGEYILTFPNNIKIYQNSDRTGAISNNITEFDATQNTHVYVEGLSKSNLEGDVLVNMNWHKDGVTIESNDSVNLTVAESEFTVWINIFIPIQWSELNLIFDIIPPIGTKIFGGDDRGFSDLPLIDPINDVNTLETSSRVHQQVIVIPFKELDADGFKDGTMKKAIGTSQNYLKSESVPFPAQGYSDTNRLLSNPTITSTGNGDTSGVQFNEPVRTGSEMNSVTFRFFGSADNPIVDPSLAIDWNFELLVTVNGPNILAPQWQLRGHLQDGFPAYEMYIMDSDGDNGNGRGTEIYMYDPIPDGRTPNSLAPIINDEPINLDSGQIP